MKEKLSEWTSINREKNRIYIKFQGKMDVERASILRDAYRDAINQAKPGFTTVTLAEDFQPGTPEVQTIVQEMTEMAANRGISHVARVVGETPIGGMQINRLAKVRTTFPAKHFRTVEEAEDYLDNLDKS